MPVVITSPVGHTTRRHNAGAGLTVAGWTAGAVVTVLVLFTPDLHFGYRSESAHLVLNSIDACIALIVAYLLAARFRRGRTWRNLLLAQGFLLLAIAGLGLPEAIQQLTGHGDERAHEWVPLTIRLVGAAAIAAAALADARPAAMSARWRSTLAWPLALAGLLVAVFIVQLWRLPVGAGNGHATPTAQPALFSGHPLLTCAQGLSALCFLAASVKFTHQAANRDDQLLRWLGPGCALGGFAAINYVLVPSLYTDWLCTGDVLRTGAYCLFLAGAAYELQQYWRAQPHVAVLRERRLLAGQLHDGVIQELIYIRSVSHTLSNASRVDTHIIDACDRALDDVRAAVDVLSRVVNDPLALLLRRAARELESRYLIDVKLDMDDSIDATSTQKHALTRIAREAVSNAVRHGKATQIGVSLVREGDLQLMTILDDGLGFDVAGATGSNAGYGLISMREWAGTLPGSFEVHAEPGRNTLVSVRW